MTCKRCGKPLKKGYYHNGKAYGPECIKKVAGRTVNLKKLPKIKIERATEESEQQIELDL